MLEYLYIWLAGSIQNQLYHFDIALFSQNSPLGEPGGSRARSTGVSAPSSGDRVALGPAMSVRTHPGQQALTNTSSLPASVDGGIKFNGELCFGLQGLL